jgi:pilus assembly protein Flp/PilA
MMAALERLAEFGADESGATAIEYGLIAAMVAVTIIAGMMAFGGSLANMFNMISTRSKEAMGG